MNHFLKKCIFFLTLPLLYILLNFSVNIYICSNQKLKIESGEVLIIGDSHLQKGLNPDKFNSAENIAQIAEPYVLTYWKLKKVLEHYRPNTIILGFSPHNIAEFNDLKFSKEPWRTTMFKRSYPIQQFKDIDDSLNIPYNVYYYSLIKEIGFLPRKNHIHYIGEYSNSKKSNISNVQKVLDVHYSYNGKKMGISDLNIDYLDSIVNITQKEKISLVLAGTPVYKKYYSKIPEAVFSRYNFLKERYKDKALIIDQLNTSYPDSLFLDADHLNQLGAEKFSKEILQIMTND